MNITLCVRSFEDTGGQEKFFRKLAIFLAARGHDVKVLAISGAPAPGVDVRIVCAPCLVPRAARDWACARALAGAIGPDMADVSLGGQKTWNCDVIRPGGGAEAEYWGCYFKRRHFPVGLYAFLRFFCLKSFFDIVAERNGYVSPGLKRVIANSRMVRRSLVDHFPHLEGRVDVIYNGSDVNLFLPENADKWRGDVAEELGLRAGNLTGIFAGYNFALKGLRQAIESLALASITDKRLCPQLIVVGNGDRRRYGRLAERLGLRDVVRFVGATNRPERYYAAADFLLYPTFYDPCANVTLEALAAGLPVVTTTMNGAHELITHGHDGWVVDSPGDTAVIADFILACSEKKKLSGMKQAARELALKHSLNEKLAAVERILSRVAAGPDHR